MQASSNAISTNNVETTLGLKYHKGCNAPNITDSWRAQEIFIPSHKIIFNSQGIILLSDKPRNFTRIGRKRRRETITHVQIPTDFVKKIFAYANAETVIEMKKEEIDKELREFWNKPKTASDRTVTATQYNVTVYKNPREMRNNRGSTIQEIFVPSHKVIFNSRCFAFNATEARNIPTKRFVESEEENTSKMVEISEAFIERIALLPAVLNLEDKNKKRKIEINTEIGKIFSQT